MKDSWKHSRLFDFSLWCSALPYDDGILPQWWSVFAAVAQAGLEGKWDLEVSILVKMKIICSVRHNFVFIFYIVCEFPLRWKEDKKRDQKSCFWPPKMTQGEMQINTAICVCTVR